MRPRFLPSALILIFSMSASGKMTPVTKISPAPDSVKTELDKKILELSENAKILKGDANWKALSRMEADINALRKESPRQKEDQEIYITTVLLVMKEIPRPPKFKKEDCEKYKTSILAGYDPQHENEASPGVSKGLEVLAIFCR